MLVSVIIPCYNVENYIEECLNSVYSQTYADMEVIAVDNGSTDRTAEILASYKKTCQPDLVILEEKVQGASAARNRGLKHSSGEWIQFLDADDLILPEKVSHQTQSLQSSDKKNVCLVAGSYKSVNTMGDIVKTITPNGDPYIAPFLNNMGKTSAHLWNKEWLKKVDYWNEELQSSQDSDLMFRLMLAGGDTVTDNLPLCLIRERVSGQISQSNPRQRWQRFIEIRMTYLQRLQKEHAEIFYKYQQQLRNYMVSSLMILSNYDSELSIQYYRNLYGGRRLVHSDYGIRWFHTVLIFLIGFEKTVKLRNWLLNQKRNMKAITMNARL